MSAPDTLAADPCATAERAVTRAAAFAALSAWTMLVLGVLSLLISLRAPLSASFAISAAVVVNGWIERRFGRRLAACDPAAPRALALNQVALGLEILAYAFWQSRAFGPEQIEAVLRRPLVAKLIDALDPRIAGDALAVLPQAVRTTYVAIGVLAFIGCIAAAAYYGSRSRCLRVIAAGPSAGIPIQPPAVRP